MSVWRSRRIAAAVAGVAAVVSGALASLASKESLPSALGWTTTGVGWIAAVAFLILAGVFTVLSVDVQEKPIPAPPAPAPKPPVYEEEWSNSVGLIHRVAIFDRRVAEKYVEQRQQQGGEQEVRGHG